MEYPTLETGRLVLRPFALSDAPAVQRLAGDRDIAATTLLIPHPYEDGVAEKWIGTHQEKFERGEEVALAITPRDSGELVGCVGLTINKEHESAEIGYWIGKPFWNRGYATEAARALVRYGFEDRQLNRIHAGCFAGNEASARVLQKIGMSHEGRARQVYKKWGVFQDAEQYGLLRSDV